MELDKLELIDLISKGDEQAFEHLFRAYCEVLNTYARAILKDEMLAEEAVQQVFFRIWEKRMKLQVYTSVRVFLYRSVRNECLNQLKREVYKDKYAAVAAKTQDAPESPSMRMERIELEIRLQAAIDALPDQCRKIFYMSRFDGLKNKEIAQQLSLSVRTVETQMSKALKILREKLADYLPILIWLLLK